MPTYSNVRLSHMHGQFLMWHIDRGTVPCLGVFKSLPDVVMHLISPWWLEGM